MDEFGVLTERFGLKPQGKSAPMAASRRPDTTADPQTRNFASNSKQNPKSSSYPSKPAYGSSSVNDSFLDDDIFFSNPKPHSPGALGDDFDVFGGYQKNSKQTNNHSTGSALDYDSIFSNSNYMSAKSSFDDDIFGGLNNSNSVNNDDIFGSFDSKPKQSAPIDDLLGNFGAQSRPQNQNGSVGFDDLIPGFGSSSTTIKGENVGTTRSTFSSADDPFVVLESTSNTTKTAFIDPLEEISNLNHSRSTKPAGSSIGSQPLRPPPKPGQVLKTVKSSGMSSIDELEDFAMGRFQNSVDGRSNVHHAKEVKERQSAKAGKYKEAEDTAKKTQRKSADDLESFFSTGSRSSSVPKARASTSDPVFEAKINSKGQPEMPHRKSSVAPSGIKKASSTTDIFYDICSIFGATSLSGEFEDIEGESEERRRARLGRHQRTQDRVAQAVADMNQRDLQTQYEQEERHRIAEQMNVEIKHWAAGKEGNMRALLSSLQFVLWPQCGWEPVSLTDLITSASVKKVYRKATLCVHPDKVQQKGATVEQKYVAEKVFDVLKEAWNKFSKEELC